MILGKPTECFDTKAMLLLKNFKSDDKKFLGWVKKIKGSFKVRAGIKCEIL